MGKVSTQDLRPLLLASLNNWLDKAMLRPSMGKIQVSNTLNEKCDLTYFN